MAIARGEGFEVEWYSYDAEAVDKALSPSLKLCANYAARLPGIAMAGLSCRQGTERAAKIPSARRTLLLGLVSGKSLA